MAYIFLLLNLNKFNFIDCWATDKDNKYYNINKTLLQYNE